MSVVRPMGPWIALLIGIAVFGRLAVTWLRHERYAHARARSEVLGAWRGFCSGGYVVALALRGEGSDRVTVQTAFYRGATPLDEIRFGENTTTHVRAEDVAPASLRSAGSGVWTSEAGTVRLEMRRPAEVVYTDRNVSNCELSR